MWTAELDTWVVSINVHKFLFNSLKLIRILHAETYYGSKTPDRNLQLTTTTKQNPLALRYVYRDLVQLCTTEQVWLIEWLPLQAEENKRKLIIPEQHPSFNVLGITQLTEAEKGTRECRKGKVTVNCFCDSGASFLCLPNKQNNIEFTMNQPIL